MQLTTRKSERERECMSDLMSRSRKSERERAYMRAFVFALEHTGARHEPVVVVPQVELW